MNFVESVQKTIDISLKDVLEKQIPQKRGPLDKFSKVIQFALFPGGKRFRPALTIAASSAVAGNKEAAITIGTAIELIHNYSLIHDDLPCMDDASYRRGKQATHKEFNEGLAVLAGDALLTDAFVLLSELPERHKISPEATLKIIKLVASSAGSQGMVAGQVLDIKSTPRISFPELEFMAIHKTGKLIYASIIAGALTGIPSHHDLMALEKFGESMGLLFQIVDDLEDTLDAVENRIVESPRASFVQVLGVEEARERAAELIEASKKALKPFGNRSEQLMELIAFLQSKLNSTMTEQEK